LQTVVQAHLVWSSIRGLVTDNGLIEEMACFVLQCSWPCNKTTFLLTLLGVSWLCC